MSKPRLSHTMIKRHLYVLILQMIRPREDEEEEERRTRARLERDARIQPAPDRLAPVEVVFDSHGNTIEMRPIRRAGSNLTPIIFNQYARQLKAQIYQIGFNAGLTRDQVNEHLRFNVFMYNWDNQGDL